MARFADLREGQLFGSLTFSGDSQWRQDAKGGRHRCLRCICVCGNQTWVRIGNLGAGRTSSCGCLRGQNLLKHGMKNTTTYNIWHNMIQRCGDPKSTGYRYYGARGIKVCPRWRQDFMAFVTDMPPWPGKGWSIHRINNNGNYEPGNCKWSRPREQNRTSRRCKLSFANVVTIILRRLNGEGASAIALEYGVCTSNISMILTGRTWPDALADAQPLAKLYRQLADNLGSAQPNWLLAMVETAYQGIVSP